jgi:predicted ribosomally synthesized peptide with nif11-like leader
MNASGMNELRAALDKDEALRERFTAAATEQDVLDLARESGIALEAGSLGTGNELSDAELENVSGGYTFPPTDWIYCDNPWTNAYCTAKC